MSRSILVVDDDAALCRLMSLSLEKEGFEVSSARSAAEGRKELARRSFDLLISDIYLGDGTGLELLKVIEGTRTAVILVTAQGTMETAAAAGAAGVFDYLAKPFELEELIATVRDALASDEVDEAPPPDGPQSMIIGNHPSIVEVYKAVARVAPLEIPVLIRGETGTGKELVARALHRWSSKPEGPFIAVNCGAIPENLLESELFGYRRGAFTGAVSDHKGAILSAEDGTLFLDEIGELPPRLQVKLLRYLQEGEIRPIGSESTVKVNVRVVAATHRDLREEMEADRFREDFYYRLAGYEIAIPPLRERRKDIPLLIEFFRKKAVEQLQRPGLKGPSVESLEVLMAAPWPGNVRQLEHLVSRAMIDFGGLSKIEELRRLLEPGIDGHAPQQAPAIGDDLSLRELERLHIQAVLHRCQGNHSQAARILGIERKSLYRKLKRFSGEEPGEEGD